MRRSGQQKWINVLERMDDGLPSNLNKIPQLLQLLKLWDYEYAATDLCVWKHLHCRDHAESLRRQEPLAWGDSGCQVSNRPGTTQKQRWSNADDSSPPLPFPSPPTPNKYILHFLVHFIIFTSKNVGNVNSLLNLSKEYMCSLYYSYNFFGRSEIFQKVNLKKFRKN